MELPKSTFSIDDAGGAMASGLYFLRITSGEAELTQKLLLLR